MLKICYFSLALLCSFFSFSQNSFSVSGKLLDESLKLPLESATIYFSRVSDSTVVDYTISDKNGNFNFKLKGINYPVFLKISYNGYKEYKKQFETLSKDHDLGNLYLEENVSSLNEVVVQSEIPPIVIKTDTLEFNASSFKVTPDANVEALLKQLPGVEIDEEGKITVNGKEVNNILVNGKPFFGKDGKIATQNLPAEIIDKVQVTDTKTKEEELSGTAASENASTINLTIQEDKNKGMFGKATVGTGSDKRYESGLLFNYFKDTQKISILGSSNNINSIGFSMDEIFDNMGGGRNSSIWVNDNGSFGINGMQFGGNTGITKSNMIGVNFSDEWMNKKIDPNGSYYFTNAITENKNRTSRTNLLPTGNTSTNSESDSKTDVTGNAINLDFEIKIDSTTTLYVTPAFSKNKSINKFTSNATSLDESNNLLNENNSSNVKEDESIKFENSLYLYKKFQKKGRGISLSFRNQNTKNDTDLNTLTNTIFYQSGNPNDNRNQNRFDIDKQDTYSTKIGYTEPISDSLSLLFETSFETVKLYNSTNTFDFDSFTNEYSQFNDILSNNIDSRNNTFNTSVGIQLKTSKLRGSIRLGTDFLNYNNQSNYLGVKTEVKNNYMYPSLNGYLSYKLGKSKSFYSYYSYEATLPSARQLLPFEDLSNPLNTVIGNAFLKPSENYNIYINYNNYDYATRSGFYSYFGGSLNKNQIVSSTVYDNDFKANTTYQNIDQTYNFYTGFNLNKSYKKEKRTIKYGLGIGMNYNLNQGLTNAALYEARGIQLNPRASFSYSIEDLITISPTYKYSYNTTSFKNYVIDNSNNYRHIFKIEATTYWPKNIVLGNDFGYTYNSNIADGFQKDFYLWNASLGYNFFKDQLLAKVKVYDLLNQNVNATRTITPTAITDTENTVLQQYVMFSLTYKLEKFGGKDKKKTHFMMD
ncbi:outer membrane beta-barrel protein [Flavobacterium sediminilitoris]|uniref:Outer membrane beta-barrel protein n=1 Tax=Flavobacterium sediminilitoris TaxID=2024526 RepID=A0ABY4HHV7_9FLAO|nr:MULTISPECIES: outer membrane beta-barrel protein [Flavobacterium]UOX32168.1 outer membrane beta-barrel protein [Flavobacterium sediminilitoris]